VTGMSEDGGHYEDLRAVDVAGGIHGAAEKGYDYSQSVARIWGAIARRKHTQV
jgi:hypothetical protein